MLNKVFVMGRLTRDPELRKTKAGTAVASFSLAVDRDYKDKASGEREVDFVDIVAWRQAAEFIGRYFTKGRMAVVEGRLQVRDWLDQDGKKHRAVEIVADNVYFGDSRRARPGEPVMDNRPDDAATEPRQGEFSELSDNEELPF